MLSKSTVTRGLVLLEPDKSGELVMTMIEATVALARCLRCEARPRVLPYDALPRKTYGLAVIALLVTQYSAGDRSLRQVAWGQLGERTPAHTTLHGWTEGLGAYVLERPAAQCSVPFSRVLVDAESREPGVRQIVSAEHPVDERRYRSEGRRERLAAVAMLLAIAVLVTCRRGADALLEFRRRAVSWSGSCALDFPSRFSCTPIERGCRPAPARSHPHPRTGPDRCQIRTRSPPGASSRSRHS